MRMTVLLFANDFLKYSKYLRQKLEIINDYGQLIECNKISRLSEHLQYKTEDTQIGIFCVEHEYDLDRLFTIQNLLESVFVIIILPHIDDNMIAKSHRLRPRFISYPETNFEDVIAVLNHQLLVRKKW